MNARVIKEVPLEFIQSLVANVKPTTRGAVWTNQYEDVPFSFRTGRVSRIINNPTCVCCGKTVNHARIVPAVGTNTVDIGHLDANGQFFKFTVDHILLDCMGGKSNDDNLQTMCASCNTAKSDVMSMEEVDAVRRNPTKYASSWVNIPYLMYLLDMQEYEHLLRSQGIPRKELNIFHSQMSTERRKMTADGKKLPRVIVNPYADILRPPVVTGTTFAEWIKSMPSIKELVRNWLYSHNIFMYC